MPWQVRSADVNYFVAELWKDLRAFPSVLDRGEFAKDCFDRELALVEAAVLLVLNERLGKGVVPMPKRIEQGTILVLERIRGGRLFDLVRHLKVLEERDASLGAAAVCARLLDRSRSRLRLIQLELARIGPLFTSDPYPLERKLTSLLELFLRVFGIQTVPPRWKQSLEEFVSYWQSSCVSIPFRDATTKNMIVADERLAVAGGRDASHSQLVAVAEMLKSETPEFWVSVPIVDVDFSSVVHLTSIEDDPISLHCHQATSGSMEPTPQNFVLDSSLGAPDALRAASTAFVRYLRFGGRKLAYQLINSQGFKVRFAYDEPLFYFRELPDLCRALSPSFMTKYSDLVEVVSEIHRAASSPTRADRNLLEVDQLRRFGKQPTHYWQQSPLEGQE
jgi:hypothetical protein